MRRMNSVAEETPRIAPPTVLHASADRPHVATSFPVEAMKTDAWRRGERNERRETPWGAAQESFTASSLQLSRHPPQLPCTTTLVLGELTETHAPLSSEQPSQCVFSTFSVAADSFRSLTLSACGHELNNAFAGAAPLLSREAEEERETDRQTERADMR